MKHTIYFDETCNCIIGNLTGKLDFKALNRYAEEIVKVSSKHDCKRLLSDFRKAEIDFSTFDLYNIPGLLEIKGVDRLWKRALVVSEEAKEKDDYLFLKLQHQIRDIPLKYFQT